MSRAQRTLIAIGAIVVPLVAACDREDIHAYRAPKTPVPQANAAAPAPQKVTWDVPEGWRTMQSNQQVRIATFRAGAGEGVEVSVTAFPGDVGGLLANVNRWRGQVGLEPAQEADLATLVKTTRGRSGDVSIVDFAGANGQQLLAAIVRPGDGQSWFIKATGTPEAVGAVRESFGKFAASIGMGTAAAAPEAMNASGAMNAAGLPQVASSEASGEVADRLAAWKPPSNWTKDATGGVAAAAFSAKNPRGDVRITATSLHGDGGGVLMNVNRWRQQLGLPTVAAMADQPTTSPGSGATQVDISDSQGAKRMIAVIFASQDQTWFFKMTGGPTAVDGEKDAFERFVKDLATGGH